ncbi:MAG: zinc metallopeptidase [Fibrobacter sp.]|nr:zinc metallopeptidase [Fibrobacter sp.]
MMFDPLYMSILLVTLALSGIVSWMVKSRFNAGQKVMISSGLTGAEIAKAILMDAGVTDVQILEHHGFLSDHYNPLNKTLNLSREVYHGRNASAAGVAAHEVGHAIQHAQGYFPMWLRSFIVPAANLGSNLGPWLVIIGIILMGAGRALGYSLAIVGVLLFAIATLFTLVTVPVEFDASARAKKALARMEIVAQGREYNTVSGILFAAGLTYVAAAIGSIMQLLYWAYRAGLLGGRNDD